MTQDKIQKAFKVKKAVAEYFIDSNETKVMAKDLMPHFVKAGIFAKNHKDGLPIRDLLRELENDDLLKLIPQVHFEQKNTNKNWFFIKK
jgi:hypothetical protein